MRVTTIKTWCATCGETVLPAPAVRLFTYTPAPDRNYYEFECPTCHTLVQREADQHVVKALRIGEVPETRVLLPAEAIDHKRDWTLPISKDEILDFILALQGSDHVAACV